MTGAASGIGKASATVLAGRGAKVVVADVAEEAYWNPKSLFFKKTNVTKYKDYITLFQRTEREFGGVDIVFLNAGTGKGGFVSAFKDLDNKNDEFMINVNTMGVIKGTKVAILHLAKRGGGVIINTASTGAFNADLDIAAYCASKHAVVGWTRSFDLLPQIANIRVNAVSPGGVATNFGTEIIDEMRDLPLFDRGEVIPLTKMETVVRAVLTCIDDESFKGETLLALSGDIVRAQPRPEQIPENVTPELIELYTSNTKKNIDYYKGLLNKALDKYDNSSTEV